LDDVRTGPAIVAIVLFGCGSREAPRGAHDAAPRPVDAARAGDAARKQMLVRSGTCAVVPPRAIGAAEQMRDVKLDLGGSDLTQPLHLAAGGYLCVLRAITTSNADEMPAPFTDPEFVAEPTERAYLPPGDPAHRETHLIVVRDAGYERDLEELASTIAGLDGARRKAACEGVATREPPDPAVLRPRAQEVVQRYLDSGSAEQSTDKVEKWVDDLRELCGFASP
jgi:hypothetical protein